MTKNERRVSKSPRPHWLYEHGNEKSVGARSAARRTGDRKRRGRRRGEQ